MKISITGRQMTVRDSLRELITGKLSKYDKFFDDNADAQITLSHRHNSEIVEITILSGGTIFRSEEGADTFRTALDSAMDALERQIRKNKTRLEKRLRPAAFEIFAEDSEQEEEADFKIRHKTYPFKPMSVEEAILQMNLTDHQFFVFVDQDTSRTCVVYRRHGNEYGLIEPQQ